MGNGDHRREEEMTQAATSERAGLGTHDRPEWYFLSNHALVLLAAIRSPDSTVRELAQTVGVTERTAFRVLSDLEAEGYIRRAENGGRGGRFIAAEDVPLRHPMNRSIPIGQLIELLDSPGVATWRWTPATNEAELSEGAYRLHGLAPVAEPVTPESVIRDAVHADDQARLRSALEQAATLGDIDVTYRVAFPDGSLNWIRARGTWQPMTCMLYGTFTDVTRETQIEAARCAAEARLQLVFAESATPMFVFGPGIRLDAANDAFARTLGHDQPELLGKRLEEFVDPGDIAPLRESAEQLKGGGDITISAITLLGKRRRAIRCSIRLQVDGPGDAHRMGVGLVHVAT